MIYDVLTYDLAIWVWLLVILGGSFVGGILRAALRDALVSWRARRAERRRIAHREWVVRRCRELTAERRERTLIARAREEGFLP